MVLDKIVNLPSSSVTIGLCGATGKMGKVVMQRIEKFSNCRIVATFSRQNNIRELTEFCRSCEVIIDFSDREILEKLLNCALVYKNKLVIGTTGLTQEQISLIKGISKELAILYSPNMSLGANLLSVLATQASKFLGESYDIEIVDWHHRLKNDAPSGTAIMLGETLAKSRNLDFTECAVFSRNQKGKRAANEIGIVSVRGGQVHGEHNILFLGDNEVISLKHTALSRESFADGAIQAALWVAKKEPGLYSMQDIFCLNSKL
ncbi:4-hydroxy-tetrahydrodipicolinate reductase [Candidatus Tisiphia endosymbiont of Nemotelus uliginosus]|uniref:4-hydroxy-tetrahydrodipicolinate reductase n=1 Tax=Candidatus Tisiphia endosymbiont of Nemotelus uliginosus TaxID=3077926 RepID=UPI0035C8B5E9